MVCDLAQIQLLVSHSFTTVQIFPATQAEVRGLYIRCLWSHPHPHGPLHLGQAAATENAQQQI